MQKMMGLMRRCIDDYGMIEPGDRVAVGVSGGKDSLTLLTLLAAVREYYPGGFELSAFTVDMGLSGMDFSPVAAYCEQLGVPYTMIPTEIGKIVFDYRHEKNPCSMCAKMRRGALHAAIAERGIHKIALGHHHDDAVETFLMSLVFEGRLNCFQPVTYLDRTGITQIRPMLYLSERSVVHFAERMQLPVVHNTCPSDKHTKRQEIKDLIYDLSATYPDLKDRIFGAMQRLPLPEWGVQPHTRLQQGEVAQNQQQSEARQPEKADERGGEQI
jgi:tRNA(Ile)-lysidine synthase TilS/MesJ